MTAVSFRRPTEVTAPAVEQLEGTLLDAAEVKTGIAWVDGRDLFPSYNRMKFGQQANICAPNDKTFDNTMDWIDGFQFVAYGGVECSPVGIDSAAHLAEVNRIFLLGESTAVERAFMDVRFQARAGDFGWAAPVDLTLASGAVKPALGLALLEGYAASVYVASPTIHMPRVVASALLGADGVALENRVLRTKLGSKIAAGAGYDYPNTGPLGTEPAANERWMYVTGEVVLIGGDAKPVQAFDQYSNQVVTLAERAYVGATDGAFVAAVRVRLDA